MTSVQFDPKHRYFAPEKRVEKCLYVLSSLRGAGKEGQKGRAGDVWVGLQGLHTAMIMRRTHTCKSVRDHIEHTRAPGTQLKGEWAGLGKGRRGVVGGKGASASCVRLLKND